MIPNDNEMVKGKMYAMVDGEYREVMELQGEITLHGCDEQLWQYDYVRVVRCKDCKHSGMNDELCLLMCHYRKCYHLVPEDGFCNFGEKSNEID